MIFLSEPRTKTIRRLRRLHRYKVARVRVKPESMKSAQSADDLLRSEEQRIQQSIRRAGAYAGYHVRRRVVNDRVANRRR